ncbi:hypothetical protein C0J52_06889 [Blattella germanica]|nr:hypothetical protein C0J52_06889 [Blattella germanica]
MAPFQSYKKPYNKWSNRRLAKYRSDKLYEMKLRSGRNTDKNNSTVEVQNRAPRRKNKRQSKRKSGKAKKNRRKSSKVTQLNQIPTQINNHLIVENRTPTTILNSPSSSSSCMNICDSINKCSSNKFPSSVDTHVPTGCFTDSLMNNLSFISDTSMAQYMNDTSDNRTNVNQGHEPLIVDVTNCAVNASRKSRKCGSIVSNILSRESNLCDQPKITKRSGSAVYREVSTKRSNDQDDSCSVINVNSDDEIMIVEVESSSDLPPSKRQKTDIPIIDLCTPAVSQNKKKKHKNRDRNRLANGRPLSQFLPQWNVQSSNTNFASGHHHASNKVIKDNLHQTSKQAFKQYSSILGISEKETSIPSSSAMVTSSSSNKSGPGYEVDNGGFHSVFGANVYNPNPTKQVGLRPIVIDGSNVALGHSNGAYFSCKGLLFCIQYFLNRNHNVLAFVPKFRKTSGSTRDPHILDTLEKQGLVSFTPSRRIGNQLIVPYDDRYIVQYAAEKGGIIVSTDNYRDLVNENLLWKETIEKRLLMFTWAGDVLMFPQDPLGRHGPRLEEFLRFPES